jgi:hypothetical protein
MGRRPVSFARPLLSALARVPIDMREAVPSKEILVSILRAPSLVQRVVVLSLAGVLSACAASDSTGPVADPVGTVSSAIRTAGQGNYIIDFDLGTVTTTNNNSGADLYLDANTNFNVGCCVPAGQQPRRVADVGAVSGLGAVTTIPSAGFVSTLYATVGHGYVVTDNARTWRVFVTGNIIGATSGGVIGVYIKWAPL